MDSGVEPNTSVNSSGENYPGIQPLVLWSYFSFVSLLYGASNTSKCYGRLGCLEITEDWYGLTRPVNVLPEDRSIVNTQFILRTRANFDPPEYLDPENETTIEESSFNSSKPTKFIVHGFIDTGFVPWVKGLSNDLLNYGDFNVIAVDWGGGSARLYSQSAANTRLVGLELADMIATLQSNFNASLSSIHIIGHSLGSHIAGYAGERLLSLTGSRVGRISGLDPAEPLFQDTPEFVRLDPGDAEFVDVIHTDAKTFLMFGYGMDKPCGHVDFYPNGGEDQPGCSLLHLPQVGLNGVINQPDTAADSVGRHLVACSHTRAIDLYRESLSLESTDCISAGFECDSYEDFKAGKCFGCAGDSCAVMGYPAIEYKRVIERKKAKHVKMYLDTGPSAPFCQYHYLLQLNTAKPLRAERWVQGFLKVKLYGDEDEITDLDLTGEESIRISHGSKEPFLIVSPTSLGQVNLINLWWEYDHNLDPLDLTKVCLLLCSDKLYLENVAVLNIHEKADKKGLNRIPKDSSSVICGDGDDSYSRVRSEEWKLFYNPCVLF